MTNKPPNRIDYLPTASLRFDPHNPRLPSSIDGGNEQAVLGYLLKDASLIELMGSIGEQNYFSGEPLLVCANTAENGTYLVIEGNRRLASVKLLNNPDLCPSAFKASVQQASIEAKHRPEELPCVVFESREEILKYLSYRHITGIKQWDPLQKAKYLSQLHNQFQGLPLNEQLRTVAKIIGTRSDYVARLLTGYRIYETIAAKNYFKISNLNEETFEFSILTTALTYSNIRKFLGLATNNDVFVADIKLSELEDLTKWMFEKNSENQTRLGESRRLKQLSEVIDHKIALAAFREGMPLIKAAELTGLPAAMFSSALFRSRAQMFVARDIVHLVDHPNKTDEDLLREMQSLIRVMIPIVQNKIMENEEQN